MNLKSQKILGIDVTINAKTEILEEIRKYLLEVESGKGKGERNKKKPLVIYTPNPEIINYAQNDKSFKQIVNSAQINIPDGAGVVWALKKLYGIRIPKITGIDFMPELVKLAEKESLRIGLIGGRGDLAVKTAECLKRSQPQLEIEVFEAPEVEIKNEKLKIKNYESKYAVKTPRGWQAERSEAMTPPMVEESEDRYFISLINEIRERKIDILFVAMGHPKQEYFIGRLARQFQISNFKFQIILMSVGGSFDYISGRIPRAPEWLRDRGFEWVYRLIREPWRLGRQLKGAEFFLRVAFPSMFPIQYP